MSKIGDYVWQDYNADGVQESIEEPLLSIPATLTGFDALGDSIQPMKISTNSDGLYSFDDLHPGQYQVTFGNPASMVLTTQDSPLGDDANDSDIDSLTLTTPFWNIESGDTILTLDAGFYATDFGDAPNSFFTKKSK